MKTILLKSLIATVAMATMANSTSAQTLFDLPDDRNTAAISSVDSEQMQKTPTSNITNTFYGRLAGLAVMQGSGQLGQDMAQMTIRGAGTFNSSDSYTVYVDGFETDPSFITYMLPAEIENVYILKDAAALSILGMKGSNGAIFIQTKRGKSGPIKVDFNARTGWQSLKQNVKPLGSEKYQSYYNEAYSNDNGMVWNPYYTEAPSVDTDWYDAVLKPSSPFVSTDITVSGGKENIRFSTTLGYVRSNGLYNVKNDDLRKNASHDQYVIRTNLDFNIFKIFEGKVDIGGRLADNFRPNYSEDQLWYNMATYPNNIYTVFDKGIESNDTWSGTATHPDNPVASTRGVGYQFMRDRTFMANLTLKEKLDFITPGLYLQEAISFSTWTRGTYTMSRNYSRLINGEAQTAHLNENYSVSDDKGTNQWAWNQLRFQLGYDKTFGQHSITAAAAYEQYHKYVDASLNGNAGVQTHFAHQAINGRINYSFAGRYVAEAGLSWCGSDNYAKGNRFRTFPYASFAWNVHNESFLKNSETVNLLKVRASAGTTGYDYFAGGRYLYNQYYVAGNTFPTNNSGTPTYNNSLVPAFLAEKGITSETALKYNIGIDARLFDSLQMTLDLYRENRSGIITQDNSYAAGVGVTPPYKNVGKTTTQGMELTLSYQKTFGDFTIGAGGMISYLSDKINYMAEIPPASPFAALTGKNIGALIGYESDGFYDITDFDADGNLLSSLPSPQFGKVQPGDIRYKNQNDDNVIDERDKVMISKGSFPYMYYSFNLRLGYKGFDLSCLLQGTADRDVNLLDAASKVIAFRNNTNIYPIAEGRWAYYPEQGIDTRSTATYPRLSTGGNTNNYQNSDFWIRKGSFLTLRNVELGYSLPEKACKAMKMQQLRVYVNGINLLSFSPLKKETGLDPEYMTGYPALKSINIGLNIGF